MLNSVFFISNKTQNQLTVLKHNANKYELKIDRLALAKHERFDFEITFESKIQKIRNHDYTWINFKKGFVATAFAPKIILLENGFYVQPNCAVGIWEFKNEKTLLWRFNPQFSAPLVDYTGNLNEKIIKQATHCYHFENPIALLFSNKNAVEFSRSKIPFSAIACFTDHCDFDTLENLILQRQLFQEAGIKVTKGFFLNNYSKRINASFEENKEELNLWINDGHELAYHSLSQSIKTMDQSVKDFQEFVPPNTKIPVWIDHGYQPYNFSLYKNSGIDSKEFAQTLSDKNISILWNYIDSGTSTNGVINQMNGNDFTLGSFYNGIKTVPFKTRISLMIKNSMFHYYADEKKILLYKNLASNFKAIVSKKSFSSLVDFVKNSFAVAMPLLKIVLFWKNYQKQPYKLAKYAPILFKHTIDKKEFYVFQTLELIDFKKTLSEKNLHKLVAEKGLFIAHTYFSVPMKYHTGRVFEYENTIDKEVENNFKTLGDCIKKEEIWNPVLSELIQYLSGFEKVMLDVNANGTIFLAKTGNLISREITH